MSECVKQEGPFLEKTRFTPLPFSNSSLAVCCVTNGRYTEAGDDEVFYVTIDSLV